MNRYGITTLPSIVVNGKILDCCNRAILIYASIGQ